MPIVIDYDAARQLLHASVIGEFTFDETQQAVTELMEHAALDDPSTKILWDMTDAALMGLSPKEVQALVGSGEEGMARLWAHRSAVLVKHDLHFGIAREYDAYQTPTEDTVAVFRSRSAALRYLELPVEPDIG